MQLDFQNIPEWTGPKFGQFQNRKWYVIALLFIFYLNIVQPIRPYNLEWTGPDLNVWLT